MHGNRETSSLTDGKPSSPAEEGLGRKLRMYGGEESDGAIVPEKLPNNAKEEQAGAAEVVEGRASTKENIQQAHRPLTQSGKGVSQGLRGVREAARESKQERFTALLHHLTVDWLRDSYYALKRQAAPGVDGVRWAEYEDGLEDRIRDLHGRVHRGAYRAQPSRRIYIPKADGRQRPIGIAALEDKIVQQGVVTILNQIYEEDFRGFSYGFRPGRDPHQALDALSVGIERKKVNWILDADTIACVPHSRIFRQFVARMGAPIPATSGRRPTDHPADPEMVEGRGERGRRVVGDEDRHSPGGGGFALDRECLSALRVRPVGGGLAEEDRNRRDDRGAIRGRSGGGF